MYPVQDKYKKRQNSSSGRIISFETVDRQFIKKGLIVPVLSRKKTEYTIGL
jgi:hypothetical protein